MKLGTKSLLWGAHAFFLHPLQVGWGWRQLWGFPWDVRLWIGFVFHDVGYFQRDRMDGDGSEEHVILGAEIVRSICGPVYADECYRHSREWCRRHGTASQPPLPRRQDGLRPGAVVALSADDAPHG